MIKHYIFFLKHFFGNLSWIANIKHYGHQKIISCTILCRLILSNPFHLTIGLRLNLIHNEFWGP